MTVAGGHSLDGLCYCLGEFRELSATLATRFPEQTVIETGEKIRKTAPDQVVLCGTLESGAVASVHVQYGTYRATGFWFEINGTDGDLVLAATQRDGIQISELSLSGARKHDAMFGVLSNLTIPDAYVASHVTLGGPARNVALAYATLAQTIRASEPRTASANEPDFDDAVRLHRLIDAVERAADSAHRQVLDK